MAAPSIRNITDDELSWARREIGRGNTLNDCADVLGVQAQHLDTALTGFEHISAPIGRILPRVLGREPIQ